MAFFNNSNRISDRQLIISVQTITSILARDPNTFQQFHNNSGPAAFNEYLKNAAAKHWKPYPQWKEKFQNQFWNELNKHCDYLKHTSSISSLYSVILGYLAAKNGIHPSSLPEQLEIAFIENDGVLINDCAFYIVDNPNKLKTSVTGSNDFIVAPATRCLSAKQIFIATEIAAEILVNKSIGINKIYIWHTAFFQHLDNEKSKKNIKRKDYLNFKDQFKLELFTHKEYFMTNLKKGAGAQLFNIIFECVMKKVFSQRFWPLSCVHVEFGDDDSVLVNSQPINMDDDINNLAVENLTLTAKL